MTYTGRVSGGVVVLEKANLLPEGTVVKVEPVKKAKGKRAKKIPTLSEKLLRIAGTVKGLPPDFARNHDHYIHGVPKR